jgi:site-specific DNA-methyltransferase (adenine-specific)
MSEGKKEILLGDCLELMKDIPNGSIDMILCDLPYGTTACKWDTIIPLEQLWNEYKRVIKIDGVICLTASQPFTSVLISSNIKMFRHEWIWMKDKSGNFMNLKFEPAKVHESVLVFGNKKGTYNPIMEERDENNKRKNKPRLNTSNIIHTQEFYTENSVGNNDYKYPTSVKYYNSVRNNEHPTQKPIELFEYLIKTYTNENDLVLDNTAGSGTTAIACLNTNRQFIVMEKEQKYYDIILKRVGDFNKKFETQTLFGNEM